MSEFLTIDPDRQRKLKAIIAKLHSGRPVAEVKKEFQKLIHGVSAAEVAAMEQSLIDGGMPVEEVQRLCEVHVQVFEGSLAKGKVPREIPGHPVHTLLAENKLARKKAAALKTAARAWAWKLGSREDAEQALADLSIITTHYTRKENQLFPFLEKQGFTGPSRVMWGKHDEIRAAFKEAQAALDEGPRKFRSLARALAAKIGRMIFMEEHILIPEASRRLSEREWAQIRSGESAIGFSWVSPESMYDSAIVLAKTAKPAADSIVSADRPVAPAAAQELIDLATGKISREVLDLALTTLPADISVVDENDKVLYYSDSPHRLFPRSPAVIGRSVQNCHPQKSVETVNKILAAFKNKEKDKARFWIEMGGRFILIDYYALYDKEGKYRGTLEFSQDLTELRALSGQRRLLDWN
jgi:DUF438 domain-containing protein